MVLSKMQSPRLALPILIMLGLLLLYSGAHASDSIVVDSPLVGNDGAISGSLTTSFATYSDLSVIGALVTVQGTGITTFSDENGLFALTGVPEQEVVLEIAADGLATLIHVVDLTSNPTAGGLELVMITNPPGDANQNGSIELDDALEVLREVAAP